MTLHLLDRMAVVVAPLPATADLVVLGAGPAGIGAAVRASRAGLDVVVVERLDVVGGAARSIDVAGVRCDLGSHRLHRAIDPAILVNLRELLGDDLQQRQRNGRIRLGGRWLPFPLTPTALRHLPARFAAAAARDAVTAPLRRGTPANFDDFVRSGLGPTMADRFYGPYARKLWGLDPTQISAEQGRRRIGAASPAAIVQRILKGADPDNRTFLYPRRGFGQTFEALADEAVRSGAKLCLGTTATAVSPDVDGVTVTTVASDAPATRAASGPASPAGGPSGVASPADTSMVRARHVWSTIPLPVLTRLVEPTAPQPVRAAAGRLRTRAMVLVYLVLPVDRWTSTDAHYLPEAFTPITRISEPKNYRDGHPGGQDPGDPVAHTVLCAELPCAVGDRHWRASARELGQLVQEAIRHVGLTCPMPVDVRTVRLPNAYPITPVGFEADLAVVDGWAASLDNVLTFGRQGLFVHDNAHHALSMAWAAGDALDPTAGVDEHAWSAARQRFTTHVVED